jgi:hypothetical protein
VQELLTHPLIEEVRHMVGEQLALTDRILLGEKMKTAYLDGKSILMVDGNRSEGYRTLSRQEMKVF